ncbi:hypothetical protein Scep_014148 [Stephania cephalantha]|uniref:Uncharacterized protein n=1 Tax=Stephania cephalantha TaxID=152367 RepID=A0AAP0NZ45_9MAGN
MAFHVACPITCRKICFCSSGFPTKLQGEKARRGFLEEVFRVEDFLKDPWLLRPKIGDGDGGGVAGTLQVLVPRVVPPPPPPPLPPVVDDEFGADLGELLSERSKRAVLQKRGVAASLAAEDYARRFESGVLADSFGDTHDAVGEEQGVAGVKVMCRLCFYGENEGSERAARMLACKLCSKKYHRSCLKSWGHQRDLFHLSSWVCPSCRSCEICRRTGDPTKFVFCKRCDAAYHCYCQQPPHKNVSHGPYLCPKHTRCHSCGSNVPGNGPSTRWFLSYTCCDACGRLFVKGNYCPVCLKVYRDSESTPMVCCDVCQRWVHCRCDGISDEKYLEFQADGNLYYKCAACRGDCYQVQDDSDAVQELWRRRDKADKGLIASLRAAAGLPSHEETFSISPYSDDEDNSPSKLKHEYVRPLKFSVKGSAHKTSKSNKEHGKKSSSKKYGKKKAYQALTTEKTERNDSMRSYGNEAHDTTIPGSTQERCSINQAGVMKHEFIPEASAIEDRAAGVVNYWNSKSSGSDLGDGSGKHVTMSETVRARKIVIHCGRNRHATNSPRSEASSCHKEQDLTTSNEVRIRANRKPTISLLREARSTI